jgi:mannosyltransferase
VTATATRSAPAVTRRLPSPARRTDRVVVAGLTVAALLLRLPYIGRAYWIDEALTIGIASHPASSIPGVLRHDGAPPLFYLLLHYWLDLFGSSPVATHCLPLIISFLTVPAGYWAGRELFGRSAALATSALMATNPFLSWYSTETRMYTLVVLLAIVGTTFSWRAVRSGRRYDAAGAVLSGAALLYTHAWCMYLVAMTAVTLLVHALRAGDRRLQKRILLGGVVVVALWLPWVPTFVVQTASSAAPWAGAPSPADFFSDPATVLGGTLAILIVPLLGAGAVLTWWARSGRRPVLLGRVEAGADGPAPYIAVAALLTTIVGWIGAEIQPSWTIRYLAVVAGPYLIAAGGYLVTREVGRWTLWAVCVLLTIWSVIGSLLPNPNATYAKDNMGAVAAATNPSLAPGDVVIVTQTEQVPVAHFYLRSGLTFMNPMGPVADPTYVNWTRVLARLEAATPCRALAPTLNAMPVGSRVLEIDPFKEMGVAGSAWSTVVTRQMRTVDAFLASDPALHRVGIYAPGLDPRPFSPVYGVMWQKTSAAEVC